MPNPTNSASELGEDLRVDLEAAFKAAETSATDDDEGAPAAETPPTETPPAEGETPPTETPPAEGEVDPKLKLDLPKDGADPGTTVTPPVSKPDDKAPGTWSPEAREQWAALPQPIKEQVWKREREASRALTLSANARRFEQEFSNTMQPYLGFIAAENSTPMQAVNYMMRTGAMLRVGTAQQKAELVAGIIKDYGIDLRTLDSLMAGEAPEHSPEVATRQIIQRELAPIMQFMQQQHQGSQAAIQAEEAEIASELDDFASKHEFYWDVKDEMMAQMEVALRMGRTMTLTQAYERATMESEPVRRVIEARKTREKAIKATQRANAARQNASSITGSDNTSVVTPAKGTSLRDDIVAAIDAQPGR